MTSRALVRSAAAVLAAAALAAAFASDAQAKAPYSAVAGKSEAAPTVHKDRYGNATGHDYDLAVDGAFEGQTVVVLHLYTGEGFDFALPKRAIRDKGFSVFRWLDKPPSAAELDKALSKACELWIISGSYQQLNGEHLAVIKKFFDAGHGLYIWGDNDPYNGDANFVAGALFGAHMSGDLEGMQVVGLQQKPNKRGLRPNHALSTGIERLFEGHTVATIAPTQVLEPLFYGSADNLIAAFYDKDGKRAILDGAFTRLYWNWDTAGTERYVKNAAAWLANFERFGDRVVSEKFKDGAK
jgi:hypothetical protein